MDGSKSMAAGIPVGPDLTPEEWARAQQVFLELLEQPPERRLPSACSLCADSRAVLDAVQRLLAGHQEESGLFGPPPEPQLRLPLILGSYRLVEEVGRGGMGTVYRAERADGQFEKRAAVKLLSGDLVTPRSIERFRNERQILAGLEHPYIARLLDGGVADDGCPYIIMEYVEGIPVDRYCREQALNRRQIVELSVRICSAVEYAHAHGIVHRDIKPGNLIVTPDGTPKLLDFGISLLADQAGEQSVTGEERTRAATPHYASPEQLNGWTATPASDVYSLGILCRDLLRQPDPARRLPNNLRVIVEKATAADPHSRYASGKEMREDLDRYLAGLPVAASSKKLIPWLVWSVSRFRWRAAVTVLVLLCVGGAVLARHQAKAEAARKALAVRAVGRLFWDTQKRVSALPGSRASRRQLIQEAVQQLQVLQRDSGDDSDVLYELAFCYGLIASAQGSGGYSVGDFTDSARAYSRAIAWSQRAVRQSGSQQAKLLLVAMYASAANNQLWNSEFGAAQTLALEGQSVLDPSRTHLLQANGSRLPPVLLQLLDAQGEALEAQGQIDRSREVWLEADALADRISIRTPGARSLRAGVRLLLALSNCNAGYTEAGTNYAVSAVSLAEPVMRTEQGSRAQLLKAKRALGECELLAGRTREASSGLEAVRQEYRQALGGESPWTRTGLADTDRILGAALLGLSRFDAAAAVYQEGLDALSSPPDFASSRIAESNRAELLAGRGRLEQAQAASSRSSSLTKQFWRAACADYRSADAIFQEWAANRGMYLSSRRAMADVDKELPNCVNAR
jgi:serine/threonine protein kinase